MNSEKIVAESIAKDYIKKEDSKLVALKKLDRKAKKGATIFAYTFGSIMVLVLGVGMCLAMKVIGDGSTLWMVLGVVIGVIGIAGCGLNNLLYKKILAKGKEKYGNDIIALAKEISDEEK